MGKETNEAKLRNALSPIYGLTDLITTIAIKNGRTREQLIKIANEQAMQAMKNRAVIDDLLDKIEASRSSLPVKDGYSREDLQKAFKAGERYAMDRDGDVYSFEPWLSQHSPSPIEKKKDGEFVQQNTIGAINYMKICDCSRKFDYTANFVCDGRCK